MDSKNVFFARISMPFAVNNLLTSESEKSKRILPAHLWSICFFHFSLLSNHINKDNRSNDISIQCWKLQQP